jgi:predicted alpha/beta-fold hydrolase
MSFKTSFLLKNRHIQTLFATFFRKTVELDFDIEKFWLDDGDFVECFWYNKPDTNSTKPIVILFHGLEGSYKSPYIQGMMQSLATNGFTSVLMHFRGCSEKDNLLPRSYHSGDSGDAKAWIEYLSKKYINSPLFAVGFSLGGNMLLKLTGEYADKSPLKASVSVSAPLQLDICANQMNRGFSKIYQAHLMKHLKKSLLKKYRKFPMQKYLHLNEKQIDKLKTFWDFDGAYTAPIHGFKSADDYYKRSSSRQFLKDIQTPTLIIHAKDDPFMTPKIIPQESELSKYVRLELSNHGGHVGFVGGSLFKPKYWLEKAIVDFLKNFIHVQSKSRNRNKKLGIIS